MRRRPATRRWPATVRPSEDENRELIRRAQAGDRAARDEFIRRNTPMAVNLAIRHGLGEHDTDDLVQEGLIQLDKTLDAFDFAMGTKVSTYAYRKVRAGMGHWRRRRGSLIKVPENLQSDNEQMRAMKARDPANYELVMGRAAVALAPVASIYAGEAGYADGYCIADSLSAREEAEPPAVLGVTWDAISRRLGNKAKYILRRRYFEGETLAVVAEGLGVTKQAVQQVEARAIERLREIFADMTA